MEFVEPCNDAVEFVEGYNRFVIRFVHVRCCNNVVKGCNKVIKHCKGCCRVCDKSGERL